MQALDDDGDEDDLDGCRGAIVGTVLGCLLMLLIFGAGFAVGRMV